jgi:transcriptional regulator with XRE-family HTH domain
VIVNKKEIGERVKQLRTMKGVSIENLAKKAKLSYQYTWRIENSSIKNVGLDTYMALSNALGVPLSYLLFGEVYTSNTEKKALENAIMPGNELLPLTPIEKKMLEGFRNIEKKEQKAFLNMIETIARK